MATTKRKKRTIAAKSPKKNNFTLDRETGRWRNNGRYCKPPKKSQLRKDTNGRPLDSTGKQVRADSLAGRQPPKTPRKREPSPPIPKGKRAPPKRRKPAPKRRKPAPAPPKRPMVPVPSRPIRRLRERPKRPRRGAVELVADGGALTEKALLSSTFENQAPPTHVGELLYDLIGRKANKAGKDSDDIPLYRYGVTFTNTAESGNETQTGRLVNKLATEYPALSFQYNANNLTVTMGDSVEPSSRYDAMVNLASNADDLTDIWAYLSDLWDDDLGWFVIAENDDFAGGS